MSEFNESDESKIINPIMKVIHERMHTHESQNGCCYEIALEIWKMINEDNEIRKMLSSL